MRRGAHGSPGELRSPGRSYDTETVFYHFSGSVCLFRHIVPMLPPTPHPTPQLSNHIFSHRFSLALGVLIGSYGPAVAL